MSEIAIREIEPCTCGCGLGRHLPITGRPCEECPCARYVKAPPAANRGIATTNAQKRRCPLGHEYTPANTYPQPNKHGAERICRTCKNLRQNQRRALMRAGGRDAC